VDALKLVLAMVDTLAARGIVIEHLDIGGGLGVRYREETPPEPRAYAEALLPLLAGRQLKSTWSRAAPSPPMPACC
jgi:diaminopimelate decarboxylase